MSKDLKNRAWMHNTRGMKRYANKKVRNNPDVPRGKQYRKLFCSWDIKDYHGTWELWVNKHGEAEDFVPTDELVKIRHKKRGDKHNKHEYRKARRVKRYGES